MKTILRLIDQRLNKIFLRCVLVFLCLSLSSCLNIFVNESLKLNDNGSGQALLRYSLATEDKSSTVSADFLKEITVLAREAKGIRSFDIQTHSLDSNQPQFTIAIQFDDLRALSRLKKIMDEKAPASLPGSTGNTAKEMLFDIDWKIRSFTSIEVTRKFMFPAAGSEGNPLYGDSSMTFMYEFPKPPAYSNAHQTALDGRLLIWKFNPGEFKEGETPSMVFSLNPRYVIPMNTVVGIGGILAGLCGGLIYGRVRRKTKKKKADSKIDKSKPVIK